MTEATLRAADGTAVPPPITRAVRARPRRNHAPRASSSRAQITAGAPTTYDKVRAIEDWMGDNTKYSLNAPLSPARRRRGRRFLVPYAPRLVRADREQPGRPGPQRRHPGPARHGLRARRARRASPGASSCARRTRTRGPRSTSRVSAGRASTRPPRYPLAGDAKPGGSWLTRCPTQRGAARASWSWLRDRRCDRDPRDHRPYRRRRRSRRASWSAAALHRLERAGRKAGRARAPAETPREYAHALAERLGDDRLGRGRRDPRPRAVFGPRRARFGSRRSRRGANLALTVKGIL